MKNYLSLIFCLSVLVLPQLSCQATKILYETKTPNTLTLKEGATAPSAEISDMSWYAGRWVGKGFGGDLEENIGPVMGNSMIGSFRLVQEGEPVFYEFIAIIAENGTLAYKVKHFNPDLTGWESKETYTTFPLVKMGEQTVWFDGMTIKRIGEEVTLYLAMTTDGKVSEEKLVMRLAN